jgi:hypothetical protein
LTIRKFALLPGRIRPVSENSRSERRKIGSEKRTGKIDRVTPNGIGIKFTRPGYAR